MSWRMSWRIRNEIGPPELDGRCTMSPPIAQADTLRRGAIFLICCLGAFFCSAGPSFAADAARGEPAEVIFFVQLVLLMLIGRLLGEVMTRIGQPSVMGMLLAGMLLGPSVLGVLWPELQHAIFPRTPAQKAMLDGIAQFGILLLLLLTGMEIDLRLVKSVGKAA